jgi:hypothetical protein
MGNVVYTGEMVDEAGVADDEFGCDVFDDSGSEFRRARGVERNDDDAAEEAAEESGDPVGGVGSPEHEALAGGDAAAVEFGGETAGEMGEFAVSGAIAADAAMSHNRCLVSVLEKIRDQAGEIRAHVTIIDALTKAFGSAS